MACRNYFILPVGSMYLFEPVIQNHPGFRGLLYGKLIITEPHYLDEVTAASNNIKKARKVEKNGVFYNSIHSQEDDYHCVM